VVVSIVVFRLQRRDQPVQHATDAIDAFDDSLVIRARNVSKALRDFELNINLALRAERDIEMMQERSASLSPGSLADIRGN
jgi:hypothetical protein